MNEYVIDANVIFSAVIRQKEIYESLLEQCVFYTPDFALNEIQRYREVILKKTRQNPDRLRTFSIEFFRKVVILPDYVISNASLRNAVDLCADIDPKDTVYVALSVELQLPLLTTDKPLIAGLQAKSFDLIRPFDDLVR
ncbi:PIN domain-containing protein [Fibrella aquatilis]|uniref:DNA-binding protein n=1 Tax=Fibrella aquatilis TaxID=2817059 RepID=A0A939G7X5_9BACT|nr:PIN domain-containing protein [Fibrella aquatilis]MBO0932848.1 DNA-binding protein [Fibrella aquatilis]